MIKCLLEFFAHFSFGCLLRIEFWEFFRYSGYKPFIRYVFCKYFLPNFSLSFQFFKNVFQRSECKILMKFNISIFLLGLCFLCPVWWAGGRGGTLPSPKSQGSSFINFTVWALTFKFVHYLGLIFVCGKRVRWWWCYCCCSFLASGCPNSTSSICWKDCLVSLNWINW